MSERDAIVIGGGIGGLVASAYLARSRASVLLLEARNALGGEAETKSIGEGFRAPAVAHTIYALDPMIVRDLELHRHGLAFAERDMKLVALRPGGSHIVLARDPYLARLSIAAYAKDDAEAYIRFRRDSFAFARRLRPLWSGTSSMGFDGSAEAAAAALKLSPGDAGRLSLLARQSASALLDGWFESDAVKAAMTFDVALEGISPQEAGSALALMWRYAQESCGLQGATSQPVGGPGALADAIASAARNAGAEIRTGARVAAITIEGGRTSGVKLESGEMISADAVISSLPQKRTLNLVPAAARRFRPLASAPRATASAKLLLALNGAPPFAGLPREALRGRLVIAERPESAAEAKGAALTGNLPGEMVLEAVVPTAADGSLAPESKHVMSVLVPFLPTLNAAEWEARRGVLANRILATLESYAPGLRDRIAAQELLTPPDIDARYGAGTHDRAWTVERLLAPMASRVRTVVEGLYSCGADAEPCSAISGRVGRLAATLALTAKVPA